MDIKWANIGNLCEIKKEVVDKAEGAAMPFMYGPVNLILEMRTSSSGMYGKWHVRISPCATVMNVSIFNQCPTGMGGDINEALEDFALKMDKFCKEHL